MYMDGLSSSEYTRSSSSPITDAAVYVKSNTKAKYLMTRAYTGKKTLKKRYNKRKKLELKIDFRCESFRLNRCGGFDG